MKRCFRSGKAPSKEDPFLSSTKMVAFWHFWHLIFKFLYNYFLYKKLFQIAKNAKLPKNSFFPQPPLGKKVKRSVCCSWLSQLNCLHLGKIRLLVLGKILLQISLFNLF